MKRKFELPLFAAASVLALAITSPALATEGRVLPFFKASVNQRNISIDEFRRNMRTPFYNEEAFQLLRKRAERITGLTLTDGQLISMVQSNDQTKVRACPVTEKITTGGLQLTSVNGGAIWNFYWFDRFCRSGEQIIQLKNQNGEWEDWMSLNCGNTVGTMQPVRIRFNIDMPPAPPQVFYGGRTTQHWVSAPAEQRPGMFIYDGCIFVSIPGTYTPELRSKTTTFETTFGI